MSNGLDGRDLAMFLAVGLTGLPIFLLLLITFARKKDYVDISNIVNRPPKPKTYIEEVKK